MEQLWDADAIFLSVGQLFYQILKNRAILGSNFVRWCLTSGQRSKFVRWISLGNSPLRCILIVRLDSRCVDEVYLAKVAHYLQNDQIVDLNGFNVADMFKAGQILGVIGLTRICSKFLEHFVGHLTDNNTTEITILRREFNNVGQFPNKTFLISLMVKEKLLKVNQNLIWDSTVLAEDSNLRQASILPRPLAPWSFVDGVKRKSLFRDLATVVAPESYDDSEILYMMEMTSVQKGQEIIDGIGIFDGKQEVRARSPRTLPEEWLLSPAKSVDLDEEFADMDREFLHAIYDDD